MEKETLEKDENQLKFPEEKNDQEIDHLENDRTVLEHENEASDIISEQARIQEQDDLNSYILSSDEDTATEDVDSDAFPVLLDDEDYSTHDSDGLDLNPFDGLPYSTNYYQLLDKRKRLPVWRAKDDFVMAVEESNVVLVTGKAGSGKSTQIPQWCAQLAKETDLSFGTVVCTQPTAIAAMSIALLVAQEMDFTNVGTEVGYQVPQQDCTSEDTVLKFTTDEILLREMSEDPLLRKYSFVVIDEIQERSVATDILLALLRVIQSSREELKVILISLIQEMPKLEEFFEGVPIVDLHFLDEVDDDKESSADVDDDAELSRRERAEERRNEQIEVLHLPLQGRTLIEEVTTLVLNLHSDQELQGDILVFLPTPRDVDEACDRIAREIAMKTLRRDAGEAIVVGLHRSMAVGSQQAVYDKKTNYGDGVLINRRVIVCDDIAESCFSMENITMVVDTGVKYEKVYNTRFRTYSNVKQYISQVSAALRMDRCKACGKLYKLYDKVHFEETAPKHNIPPIKRSELTSELLMMKRLLQRMNISLTQCQLLEAPDPESYMLALEELDYHGALDENGGLSDLGLVMSEIPLSLAEAKVVIASCGEGCTQEILTIIAMLKCSDLFVIPPGLEGKAAVCKRSLVHKAGDHFTLLNIFHRFARHKRLESWCNANYLSYDALNRADKKRRELLEVMEMLELPISEPVIEPQLMESSVKKALLAGYFMQIAKDTDGCGNYHIIRDKHISRLHPDSGLVGQRPEWVIYDKFQLTENSYLSTVSHVDPDWIAEIVPQSYLTNLPDNEAKETLLRLAGRQRGTTDDFNPNDVRESIKSPNSGVKDSRQVSDSSATLRTGLEMNRTVTHQSDEVGDPTSDDVDVLTQAVRDAAYVYGRASEYVRDSDYTSEGSQCNVQ